MGGGERGGDGEVGGGGEAGGGEEGAGGGGISQMDMMECLGGLRLLD